MKTVYFDTFNTHKDCADEKKKVDDKCKPEPEQTQQDKKDGKPAKKKGLMGAVARATHGFDEVGRKATGYSRNADNAWVDSHCEGMWIKPKSLDGASSEINNAAQDAMKKIKGEKWNMIPARIRQLVEVANNARGQHRVGARIVFFVRQLFQDEVKNFLGPYYAINYSKAFKHGLIGTLVQFQHRRIRLTSAAVPGCGVTLPSPAPSGACAGRAWLPVRCIRGAPARQQAAPRRGAVAPRRG